MAELNANEDTESEIGDTKSAQKGDLNNSQNGEYEILHADNKSKNDSAENEDTDTTNVLHCTDRSSKPVHTEDEDGINETQSLNENDKRSTDVTDSDKYVNNTNKNALSDDINDNGTEQIIPTDNSIENGISNTKTEDKYMQNTDNGDSREANDACKNKDVDIKTADHGTKDDAEVVNSNFEHAFGVEINDDILETNEKDLILGKDVGENSREPTVKNSELHNTESDSKVHKIVQNYQNMVTTDNSGTNSYFGLEDLPTNDNDEEDKALLTPKGKATKAPVSNDNSGINQMEEGKTTKKQIQNKYSGNNQIEDSRWCKQYQKTLLVMLCTCLITSIVVGAGVYFLKTNEDHSNVSRNKAHSREEKWWLNFFRTKSEPACQFPFPVDESTNMKCILPSRGEYRIEVNFGNNQQAEVKSICSTADNTYHYTLQCSDDDLSECNYSCKEKCSKFKFSVNESNVLVLAISRGCKQFNGHIIVSYLIDEIHN